MRPAWRLGCLCLLYLLYLFLGAILFSAIEHPIERKMLEELRAGRKDFLAKHSHQGVKGQALDSYVAEVVSSSRRGVTLADENVPNWSLGQSFFFSATVITTIGYGQQTPLSPLGKMFCMVYATLGIPLTLLLLSAMVDRLMSPVSSLLSYLNSRLGHIYSPFRIRCMHLCLVGGLVVTLFLALPASILDTLEPQWSWFDSFYYCFISLTTVGLGDFIPGDEPGQSARSWYKSFTAVYLVVGVMSIMLLMRVFHSVPELDYSAWFRDEEDQDPERQRLQETGSLGPLYSGTPTFTQQNIDQAPKVVEQRRVVRARSRRDSYDDEDGKTEENNRLH